jgi:hypothetical protein
MKRTAQRNRVRFEEKGMVGATRIELVTPTMSTYPIGFS